MSDNPYLIGIDTGGTFTDSVIINRESGAAVAGKALSTPEDFAAGLFESVGFSADQLGLSVDEVLGQTDQMIIGTTVGTNAFLERKGAPTGLITTKGFRDSLFLMRSLGRVAGRRPEDLLMLETTAKPEPIVPKRLIREVRERVDSSGTIVVAPDRDEVLAAATELVEEGMTAISICFLWSFKESANERQVCDWIAAEHPGIYLSCSHEIAPRIGEFQRFAGTTINAYVGPPTARYLDRVQASIEAAGYRGRLLVMGCDGGVRSAQRAAEEAVVTLNSGPAGGVAGSAALGRQMGIDHLITADVGGTSFDVSVVRGGEVETASEAELGGYEFSVATIDVQSVGAGGGSIAWIDADHGTLRVGPQSAGSSPGPICYGNGGTQPTLTDADLILGYLGEESFLGEGGKLDVEAARAGLTALGEQIGLSCEEVAGGIVGIAESHMADLVRRMVLAKGHDPRDFSLFAFGGAGPVHASSFARELSLAGVVVPAGNSASVWSAYGVGTSDLKHVYDYASVYQEPLLGADLAGEFRRIGDVARERLDAESISLESTSFFYQGGLRYHGQLHDVLITIPNAEELTDDDVSGLVDAFETEYQKVFGQGSSFKSAGVEFVNFRLATVSPLNPPPLVANVAEGDIRRGEREVRFVSAGAGGLEPPRTVPIYDGDRIAVGHSLSGPAVIELSGTTIVIAPGQQADRHTNGSFIINEQGK
jgi:N-methylhydantoinase A